MGFAHPTRLSFRGVKQKQAGFRLRRILPLDPDFSRDGIGISYFTISDFLVY
jgi:hypothetical protein